MAELRWRVTRETDLPECLALLPPAATGRAALGEAAAMTAWARLLKEPSCISAVVTPNDSAEIFAFGTAVYVADAFARSEAAAPQTGLNERFLCAYASGAAVCLSREQIGIANAHGGLEQMELAAPLSPHLDASTATAAAMALTAARVQLTRGYHLAASFGELTTAAQLQYTQSVGSEVVEFANGHAFYRVTRAALQSAPGAIGAMLFQYRHPTLRLREADQRLVRAALDGATDEEVAAALGIGLANVKARWRVLFQRINALQPHWWPAQDGETRGPRRRHLLLAYCREHPEELRPYAWGAAVI